MTTPPHSRISIKTANNILLNFMNEFAHLLYHIYTLCNKLTFLFCYLSRTRRNELSDGKPDIKILKMHLPYTFHFTNLKSTVPALPVGAVQVNSSDVREKALL